ncbi:hypothetical protein HY990_00815 [Candidatus Micrarchaeota archaeon]|nr:hypothetical protein [Candidatus Micrarchaeota archaeon]
MNIDIDWPRFALSVILAACTIVISYVIFPIKTITYTGCEVMNPDFYPESEGPLGSAPGLTCMVTRTYIKRSTQYNPLIWISAAFLVANWHYFRGKKINLQNLAVFNIALIVSSILGILGIWILLYGSGIQEALYWYYGAGS